MRKMLKEIQDGAFARKWIAENESGREWFEPKRHEEQECQLERVGAQLRGMMVFLDAITVKQKQKTVHRASLPSHAIRSLEREEVNEPKS
jgi:ketol-acid reductoisomerase